MAARLKNTATNKDLERLLSKWFKDGSPARDSLAAEEVQFATANLGFLKALLQITGRVNKAALTVAFVAKWPGESDMAKSWAGKICDVVSIARSKMKSVTSGAKIPAVYMEVIMCLKAWSDSARSPTPSPSPRRASDSMLASDVNALYGTSSSSSAARPITVDSPIASMCQEQAEEESAESDCIIETAPASSNVVFTFDWSALVLNRYLIGSTEQPEPASMAPGPDGFAVATFLSGEVVTTECTNSMLAARDAVMRKPAARGTAVCKRPAAVCKRPAAVPKRQATRRRIRGKQTDPSVVLKFPVSLIPKATQLRYRYGCGKCRGVPFCTRSCYKYRGQLADDVA
jgi:hypothetical protein